MDNFNDPVVGNKEVIRPLVTVDTLNNGECMSYALGIGVDEVRGLKSCSHGGAAVAHRAFAIYFPEINSGVVTKSNNANFNAGKIAIDLAEVFFKDAFEPEEEEAEDPAEGEGKSE